MVKRSQLVSGSRNDISHSLRHLSGFMKVDYLRLTDVVSIKRSRIKKDSVRAILFKDKTSTFGEKCTYLPDINLPPNVYKYVDRMITTFIGKKNNKIKSSSAVMLYVNSKL